MVDEVDVILRELKNNVQGTKQVLKLWETNLLFKRKSDKTYTFTELNEEFNKSIEHRHNEMNDNGKDIGKNVSSSYRHALTPPSIADIFLRLVPCHCCHNVHACEQSRLSGQALGLAITCTGGDMAPLQASRDASVAGSQVPLAI